MKPSTVKRIASVQSGKGEEQQPGERLPPFKPEKLEAYSQFLNHLIRGQIKAITTIGGNPDSIVNKCPQESENSESKIPKQMQVCQELNVLNKKIVEDFKKDSLKTLCLLTQTPDLDHNLFQWE